VLGVWLLYSLQVSGAVLQQRKLELTDPTPTATSDYAFSFTIATAGTLGSIRFQVCSNDPIVDEPCVAPLGFDASAATLSTQTGETGFVISPASTANNLILTRALLRTPAVLQQTMAVWHLP
jgi:hypothetical protein